MHVRIHVRGHFYVHVCTHVCFLMCMYALIACMHDMYEHVPIAYSLHSTALGVIRVPLRVLKGICIGASIIRIGFGGILY